MKPFLPFSQGEMEPKNRRSYSQRHALQGSSALSGQIRSWALAAMMLGLASLPVAANPTGGTVVSGSANITSPSAGSLVIDQSTNRAIINWQGFSIDAGESTTFQQPSTQSVTLNRVVGDNLSEIHGSLSANGNIFLVNPRGVIFGAGAQVDVGGLVATTANIGDDDFMAGLFDFSGASPVAGASVVNHGSISIADKGLAALVAPGVENSGIIVASLGTVTLAGAETFTLDMTGDGLLSFGLAAGQGFVDHSGAIEAQGGSVLLTAEAADGVVDSVINMSGSISAQTAALDQEGRIVLSGGDAGLVEVTGSLDASGREAGQTGGEVQVLGQLIALRDDASVDVSGDQGGGQVNIGGNYLGAGPLPNAERSLVEGGAVIMADALSQGDGGEVIVWADEVTGFNGTVSATGGLLGGDGGFLETSGLNALHVGSTAEVDLSAPSGQGGIWLLDPLNVSISGGGGAVPDVLFADSPGMSLVVDPAALDLGGGQTAVIQATNDISILSDVNTTNTNLVFQALNDIFFDPDGPTVNTNGGNQHYEAGGHLNFGIADILTGGGNLTAIAGTNLSMSGFGTINSGSGDAYYVLDGGAMTIGGSTGLIDFTEVGQIFAATNTGFITIGEAMTAGTDGRGTGASLAQASSVTLVDSNLNAPNVSGLHLSASGQVQSGIRSVSAPELLVSAGGEVRLNTSIGTFAADAPGQDVILFENDDIEIGTVDGVEGVTANDFNLFAGTVTFNAPHTINGILFVVSEAAETVFFNQPLNGPGDLYVESDGGVFFNSSVGASQALDTVIIGDLLATFSSVESDIAQNGIEAASLDVLNRSTGVTISGTFNADSVLIRTDGSISGPNSNLSVNDLLVSGTDTDLFGSVQGVSGLGAAFFAFSSPETFLGGSEDVVENVEFDPTLHFFNTCEIETLCQDPVVVTEIVPISTTGTSPGSENLEEVPLFVIDPSLRFVELFELPEVVDNEFEERFSTTGNEEIW